MIYDKIENWKTYFKGQVFEQVFEQLKSYDLNSENGSFHHEGFYFKVMEYDTKADADADIIESHRREVDIQLLLAGEERIKMYHLEDLTIKTDYNTENDCVFYNVNGKPYTELILKPGYMAVFFPSDPHHPQFRVGEQAVHLKKIVIKVNKDLF